MSKLALSDTADDIMLKMADGNPGALSVLWQLMTQKFSLTSGAMMVMWLDEWGIYGEDIWILYKNKCHEDYSLLERAFRAVQLGFIGIGDLKDQRFDAETCTKTVDQMFEEMKSRTRRN